MKHLSRKLLALGLSAVMLTGLMTPALASDGNKNTAGRDVTYTDIGTDLTTDETDFYKAVVGENATFLHWLNLAYLIHENHPESYRDNAGNGWDTDFGGGHEDEEYPDYIQDMQVARYERETSWGVSSSGLSIAYSLKEVQQRAADDLAKIITRDVTGNDFMDHHKIDALTEKSQPVIYSTVVMKDKEGWSQQFHYNAFGIAFYDFQLHTLSSENAMSGAVSTETEDGDEGQIVLTRNNNGEPAQETLTLTTKVTETTSATITNSESYSFGQSIGASLNLGELGSFSPRFTIAGQLNFSQVMETAYSEQTSIEKSSEKSDAVVMTIPPHTVVTGAQNKGIARQTTTFNCPVGVTYRVAIFSMSGAMYDDGISITSFSGYDQNSFITTFGSDVDLSEAVENLYQRADKHKGDASYERTYGSQLNWKGILDEDVDNKPKTKGSYTLYRGTDLIKVMEAAYPMSESGASISVLQDSVSTVLGAAQPILPITDIGIPWQGSEDLTQSLSFELTVGESHPISTYRVHAHDSGGEEYYGFVPAWGTWKIVDAEGKEVASPVAEVVTDSVTGTQTLTAKAPGITYVKYFIVEKRDGENYTYVTWDGAPSLNQNIKSTLHKIVVSEAPAEKFSGSITLEGSVAAEVGKTLNLNSELTATAYDPTGREAEVSVSWEAQELPSKGITVEPNGTLTATQAGTFHVRAYCDDVYSNWAEVIVTEPEELVQHVCGHAYTDVDHDAWYDEAVEFVNQNGIMNGTGEGNFSPDTQVDRAMVVQVLHRLAGSPEAAGAADFADVDKDAWYAKAVAWAAEQGVALGHDDGTFAPLDKVTWEQLKDFLLRYAQENGLTLPDMGALDPQALPTRAELAQALMDLLEGQEN